MGTFASKQQRIFYLLDYFEPSNRENHSRKVFIRLSQQGKYQKVRNNIFE